MRGAGLTILACAAALTAGCVTQRTTSDGRPPAPDPTPAPAVPVSAVVNTMTVIAAPPVDTNGNLFRDRVDVEVYLFAQPHLNHHATQHGGVLAEPSARMLQAFFAERRARGGGR